jgi:hypothetical protein
VVCDLCHRDSYCSLDKQDTADTNNKTIIVKKQNISKQIIPEPVYTRMHNGVERNVAGAKKRDTLS